MRDIKDFIGSRRQGDELITYAITFANGDQFCKIMDLLGNKHFYHEYEKDKVLTLNDFTYDYLGEITDYEEYVELGAFNFLPKSDRVNRVIIKEKYVSHNNDRIESQLIETNYKNERYL